MMEKIQALKGRFTERLQSLDAEERQLAEALERVRTARVAQEGAIRGLEILIKQLEDEMPTTDT